MTTKAVFCRLIFFVNLEIDHSSTFSKKYTFGDISFKKKFSLIESWDDYILENAIKDIIKNMNLNFKDLGQPLRLVLLGTMNGPSLTKIMKVIGKEATLKKIKTNWI